MVVIWKTRFTPKPESERILGEWVVNEYERSTHRKIKSWSFRSFNEADEFRFKREEFYRTIGLDKKRVLAAASPDISNVEMELFERIVTNPDWLNRIMRKFVT